MKIRVPVLLSVLLLGIPGACESQPDKPPAPSGPKPDARERAIEAGLGWLARHQLPDGSWRVQGVDAACTAAFDHGQPKSAWIDHYDTGTTALGILAFVRAGQSSAVVTRALDWLRAQQNEQGFFSKKDSFLYNEALATLALAEHYAATKDAAEAGPAQRAVDFLVRAQRPSPSGKGRWGWRYSSRMEIEQKFAGTELDDNARRELFDSDVSVTGWAAAALVVAERAGLEVDPAALAGAAEFVRWCRTRDGLVGYNDPKNAGLKVQGRNDHFTYHPCCMTAIALRIANEIERKPDDPFLEPAAARLAQDLPEVSADGLSIDYYYWLNGTLGLASCGGSKYMTPWERSLRDALLGLQEQKPEACGRGGWLVPDRWSYAAGPVYTTAMALLALEQKS
jgi:hypothetical protein